MAHRYKKTKFYNMKNTIIYYIEQITIKKRENVFDWLGWEEMGITRSISVHMTNPYIGLLLIRK